MTVNRNELIKQICANFELSPQEAEKLRIKLSEFTDERLKQELTMSLSGKNAAKPESYSGPVQPDTQTKFKGNVFGSGFNNPKSMMGLEISKPKKESQPEYTQIQQDAVEFLGGLTAEANSSVIEREKEAGVLSDAVNVWQEVFNKELAKSTVKSQIKDTQADLEQLKKAASGEFRTMNYITNTEVEVSFEKTFKERRGVKFDENAINECKEQSEIFARVKTATDIIKQTKGELGFSTKGDVASQLNPEKASASIIKAFKLSGVTNKSAINATLKEIEEKYKDHPDIKKYGGDFRISKNKAGKYVVYRTAQNGFPAEATNEELKIIAKEMSMRLDKAYATALGADVPEKATAEQLEEITQKTFDKYQNDYEKSFAKAYGKKDLRALSEKYIMAQQQGVANIEMAINVTSMALMIVPGGAVATSGWLLKGSVAMKNTATLAKTAKVLGLVDKSKKLVKTAQTLQKTAQVLSPVIMANMTLRPTELLEQLSSKNGMSAEEWETWGKGVLQNATYMALGMGSSKIAEQAASMYKTKALVNTLKQAGKTTDEIAAMVKANPVKFPNDIVKSFKSVDNISKGVQVSSEVALDISSTYVANQMMGNGDLTKQDWVMSVGFALSGGVLQKQFAPLSSEAKVKYLQDAFREINISKDEAMNILKTMDDISAGKIRVKKTKVQNSEKGNELPEVVAKPEAIHEPEIPQKLVEVKSQFVKVTAENFEKEKAKFIKILKNDKEANNYFSSYESSLKSISSPETLMAKQEMYTFLKSRGEVFAQSDIPGILSTVSEHNVFDQKEIFEFLSKEKDLPEFFADYAVYDAKAGSAPAVKEFYNFMKSDPEVLKKESSWFCFVGLSKDNVAQRKEMYTNLNSDKLINESQIFSIVSEIQSDNASKIKEVYEVMKNEKDFPVENYYQMILKLKKNSLDFVKNLCKDTEFVKTASPTLFTWTKEVNIELARVINEDKNFPEDKISKYMSSANKENINDLIQSVKDKTYLKSETEILLEKKEQFDDMILSKLNKKDYDELYESYKGNKSDMVGSAVLYEINFTDAEKVQLKEHIKTYGAEASQKMSDNLTDEKLIYEYYSANKKMLSIRDQNFSNIAYDIECAKSNNGFDDMQLNDKEIIDRLKSNEYRKLSDKELGYIHNLITDVSNPEEQLMRVKYDYTQIQKRNIGVKVLPDWNPDYSTVRKHYAELLYCSEEVFAQRAKNIQNRPLLQKWEGMKDFDSWKMLTDMSDEEYARMQTPVSKRDNAPVDMNAYRAQIEAKIKEPRICDYDETEKILSASKMANLIKKDYYEPSKILPFQKLPKKVEVKVEKLRETTDLLAELEQTGSVKLSIKDEGGLNPTRAEAPVIHPEDVSRLGRAENSFITIDLGEKMKWSNVKIARDIMQNFYDGNGHTLEGVDIEVVQNADGGYKIRVSGEGNYDYTRIEYLGDSSKADDGLNAGGFGEGVNMVAVSLLPHADTPYVKCACGDWSVNFASSSKDAETVHLTRTLTKNTSPVKGNYLEFETTNYDLVKRMLDAKDYFYHPQNEDFRNLDFENEFFGIKLLDEGQKGNAYIVQRYETSNGIDNGLAGASIVFKKMPNAPEIVAKTGSKFKLKTGRDRMPLSDIKITELISRYAAMLSDDELTQVIASLEPIWKFEDNGGRKKNDREFILTGFLKEAKSRRLGINFKKQKYVSVSYGNSSEDIRMAKLMGYKLAIFGMEDVGMNVLGGAGDKIIRPDKSFSMYDKKIHLVDEAVRILQENSDMESLNLITKEDANKPTFVFDEGGSPNTAARAITDGGKYLGHWIKDSMMMLNNFEGNLSTWLHEISHKIGGDTDISFSNRLEEVQKHILNVLIHNPSALEKMRLLSDMYNNKETSPHAIDEVRYSANLQKQLNSPLEYKEYIENLTQIKMPIETFGPSSKGVEKIPYKALPEKIEAKPLTSLAATDDLMKELSDTGHIKFDIPNSGGLNPTRVENPIIQPKDVSRLDKAAKSGMKIDYAKKINWSNTKIARDIMQNFYDGNGHTMEGVGLEVLKESDGSYKVKITGAGNYKYSHLEYIGSSSKGNDGSNAGYFGEGAKAAAVSLLLRPETTSVKHACGDWALKFSRSSDELETAHMMRTLSENPVPVKGNYMEFRTKDENLIEEFLNAKDYFYHPHNKDFQNMDFENELFGFKVLPEEEKGNLYYVQRFELEDRKSEESKVDGAINNLSIVFKRTTEDPLFEIKTGLRRGCFEIDRDRMALNDEQICTLANYYATSMTTDELSKAIVSLEPILSSKDGDDKKLLYATHDPGITFATSLIYEAEARGIKFDFDDTKMAYLSSSDYEKIDSEVREYLENEGYKFAYSAMKEVGMKSAQEIYERDHKPRSQKPTEVETKKIRLLKEALNLFKENDSMGTIPEIANKSEYVFNAKISKNKDVHALVKNGQYDGLFIDKKALETQDFLSLVSASIAEVLKVHGNIKSANYSYELTDVIQSELQTLIQKPEIAQKLAVLNKMYNGLNE